jgi:hypothetical protein
MFSCGILGCDERPAPFGSPLDQPGGDHLGEDGLEREAGGRFQVLAADRAGRQAFQDPHAAVGPVYPAK